MDETGLVNNTEEQGQFRLASEILEMMENNLTVRLFDDIGVHETVMRLRTAPAAKREDTRRPSGAPHPATARSPPPGPQ